MSTEFVKINSDKSKNSGLNKYNLLGTVDVEIAETYSRVFDSVEGSLTTVSDNDAVGKMDVARTILAPNEIQISILDLFKTAFQDIENKIDPERLLFSLSKTEDDEICITRSSKLGISKVIISDDGLIAFSFIAYKDSVKKDVLEFYPVTSDIDFEILSFKFFSL